MQFCKQMQINQFNAQICLQIIYAVLDYGHVRDSSTLLY